GYRPPFRLRKKMAGSSPPLNGVRTGSGSDRILECGGLTPLLSFAVSRLCKKTSHAKAQRTMKNPKRRQAGALQICTRSTKIRSFRLRRAEPIHPLPASPNAPTPNVQPGRGPWAGHQNKLALRFLAESLSLLEPRRGSALRAAVDA